MKVNKYWNLNNNQIPQRSPYGYNEATKKQYNSCTIVHYDRYFVPIVLTDAYVKSGSVWIPTKFYTNLVKLINLEVGYSSSFGYRGERLSKNKYIWGCRRFTRKQLITIKEAMEFHYGYKPRKIKERGE